MVPSLQAWTPSWGSSAAAVFPSRGRREPAGRSHWRNCWFMRSLDFSFWGSSLPIPASPCICWPVFFPAAAGATAATGMVEAVGAVEAVEAVGAAAADDPAGEAPADHGDGPAK